MPLVFSWKSGEEFRLLHRVIFSCCQIDSFWKLLFFLLGATGASNEHCAQHASNLQVRTWTKVRGSAWQCEHGENLRGGCAFSFTFRLFDDEEIDENHRDSENQHAYCQSHEEFLGTQVPLLFGCDWAGSVELRDATDQHKTQNEYLIKFWKSLRNGKVCILLLRAMKSCPRRRSVKKNYDSNKQMAWCKIVNPVPRWKHVCCKINSFLW